MKISRNNVFLTLIICLLLSSTLTACNGQDGIAEKVQNEPTIEFENDQPINEIETTPSEEITLPAETEEEEEETKYSEVTIAITAGKTK